MDGCKQYAALCVRGVVVCGCNIRRVLSLSVDRRIPSIRYVILRGCADGRGRVMSRPGGDVLPERRAKATSYAKSWSAAKSQLFETRPIDVN
jgi:hypothetical protein